MMYPLVLDLAADDIPVAVTCRVLGFSKQAFYKWRAKPVSDRDYDDAHLINAAIDIHHDDPEFGYRFLDPRPIGLSLVTCRDDDGFGCVLNAQAHHSSPSHRHIRKPSIRFHK